jgi:hypothetical protein
MKINRMIYGECFMDAHWQMCISLPMIGKHGIRAKDNNEAGLNARI